MKELEGVPKEILQIRFNRTTVKKFMEEKLRIAYERGLRHQRERVKGREVIGFDEFYALYPRKLGRKLAEKHWNKIDPSKELTEKIMKALEKRIKGEWSTTEKQFIPHPGTYLNQERWEDEIDEKTEKTKLTW